MYQIHRQDILEWAREYDGPPFHASILDPPYHLTTPVRFGKPGSAPAKGDVYARSAAGFMGQQWDGGGIAFDPATWDAFRRHHYPGAFILAFAGSRGYHRMACAMEESGLIIHPAMGWLTLSGFPKATQISSQLDRAAGVKGETIGTKRAGFGKRNGVKDSEGGIFLNSLPEELKQVPITAPATPLARDWAGHRYGLQALKPAFEFIAVAQVPYEGRPVDSIVATGAGALNIEQSRIGLNGDKIPTGSGRGFRTDKFVGSIGRGELTQGPTEGSQNGRWPSNFLLSHSPLDNGDCHPSCPVRLFDEQAGETGQQIAGGYTPKAPKFNGQTYQNGEIYEGDKRQSREPLDAPGPASRMFYQADWAYEVAEQLANAEPVRYEPKVSGAEREAGLDGFEVMAPHAAYGEFKGTPEHATNMNGKMRNNHPTLKPISLTKYLATLLLPPAAYAPRRILVPFAGVASEMIGCVLAGWESVTGIESNAAYVEIARARLAWWSQWPGWGQTDVDTILAAAKVDDVGQLSLFSEAA